MCFVIIFWANLGIAAAFHPDPNSEQLPGRIKSEIPDLQSNQRVST